MVGTDWRKAQCSPSVEGDGVPGISYKTRWKKALSGRGEGGGIRGRQMSGGRKG